MENNKHLVAGDKRHFGSVEPPLQPLPPIRKIAITIGDVSGISPEIIVKSLNSPEISSYLNNFVLIGNKDIFCKTADELGLNFPQNIEVIDIPIDSSKLTNAKPSSESGKQSFLSLKKACQLAKKGEIRAIVTAPLSKEAINMAGYYYSGQTEILKEYLKTGKAFEPQENLPFDNPEFKRSLRFIKSKIKKIIPETANQNQPEMLFVAENLRVLLLTRHIKLNSVSSSLTINGIIKSISALNNSLIKDFKLTNPKIAICGLNPHAGENGLLGHEEDYLIKPAIKTLRDKHGINIEGPFPADTLWAKTAKYYLNNEALPYDAYAACYHDQGLIPVKMLAMDKAVNTTINLPVIRTSPSHGTAYDIAGQNKADYESMIEAIKLACILS